MPEEDKVLLGWSSMPRSNHGSQNNTDISSMGKPASPGCVLNKPHAGMGLWTQTQLTFNSLSSVGAEPRVAFEPPSQW